MKNDSIQTKGRWCQSVTYLKLGLSFEALKSTDEVLLLGLCERHFEDSTRIYISKQRYRGLYDVRYTKFDYRNTLQTKQDRKRVFR